MGQVGRRLFERESHKLLSLSTPIVITGLSQIGMVFVGTLMIGSLGVDALASGGLGFVFYVTVFLIGIGLLSAVGVLVTHDVEAINNVSNIVHQGFFLAIALGLLSMAVLWNMPRLLLLVGQDPHIVEGTSVYLRAILWAMLPALSSIVLREFCSALERLRFVVIINIVAIPLNILANYVLMYGKFGFPQLGLVGIGGVLR